MMCVACSQPARPDCGLFGLFCCLPSPAKVRSRGRPVCKPPRMASHLRSSEAALRRVASAGRVPRPRYQPGPPIRPSLCDMTSRQRPFLVWRWWALSHATRLWLAALCHVASRLTKKAAAGVALPLVARLGVGPAGFHVLRQPTAVPRFRRGVTARCARSHEGFLCPETACPRQNTSRLLTRAAPPLLLSLMR
ncbi:hypothetical protein MAPG_03857 [Magnaporthiopsis poae ATCC 64411]|uniref:Uncharacterized protein n=1 Tax=Magnaporthiopsis poae (strain ATCC 64411 / 73-15) TaxID=644358 RepID=A0A0C4CSD8_MAGP6|nr:hypothetical protein, variant [Magnaporthiopsis poae ATCC 64411]KLU84822.1 hypothetical protein MAPG_03857 [Magnaporthiopsis poae ATCC 64411]